METLNALSLPPGFGFHPKDEELVFYLKRKIFGAKNDTKHEELIPVVDIYKHEPWDLPAKCPIPTRDSKWHFFALKDRKYPNGVRSNRATEAGYWKSTGKDREVKDNKKLKIGSKKTLVFHQGRPPSGKRTDWIMHEYYLNESEFEAASGPKDVYVICRITKRNGFVSEDRNGQKVDTNDEEKFTKTEVDTPDQPEVVAGTVVSKDSRTSDIDIDAWLEELLDPDFSIPCVDESEPQMEAEITSIAKEPEPLHSYLDQVAGVESEFLLEEDFRIILQSSSLDLNTVDINNLHGMPDTTNFDIDSLPEFSLGLLEGGFSSYASDAPEETHERSTTMDHAASAHSFEDADGSSDILKSDVHGMPDMTNFEIASWPQVHPELLLEGDFSSYVPEETRGRCTAIRHAASVSSFEDADALIQIRRTRQTRPFAPSKCRLQMSQMESRKSESVNHTVEFVNRKRRLALNEVDTSPRPVRSSESISDTLSSTESEVSSKSAPAATTIPKSDGAVPSAIHRQASKRDRSLRGLLSAGLNCLFVGACIVGTAASILYFMLGDARGFLANSASVGF